MKNEEKVLLVFNSLYEKQYEKKYKVSKNDNIDKFLKLLRNKNVCFGDNFILTYMLFGYNNYFGQEEKVRNTQLSWILSEATFDKFQKRDSSYDYAIGYTMLKKLNLQKHEILKKIIPKKVIKKDDFLVIHDSEEIIKDINPFKGTLRGVIYCAEKTTMFHPLSDICKECKASQLCRDEQKEYKKLIHLYRSKI